MYIKVRTFARQNTQTGVFLPDKMLNTHGIMPDKIVYLCGMEKKKVGRPAKYGKTEKVSLRLPQPFCDMTNGELVSLLVAARQVAPEKEKAAIEPPKVENKEVSPPVPSNTLPQELNAAMGLIFKNYERARDKSFFIKRLLNIK